MALDTRTQVHELIDHLPPAQLAAVETLLKAFFAGNSLDDASEELSEADRQALRASDEYFRNGGEGIPFEQVVSDLGFTMDQIRGQLR